MTSFRVEKADPQYAQGPVDEFARSDEKAAGPEFAEGPVDEFVRSDEKADPQYARGPVDEFARSDEKAGGPEYAEGPNDEVRVHVYIIFRKFLLLMIEVWFEQHL